MSKIRTAVHLSPQQLEKLAEIAKKNGGTVAGVIRLAVDDWLEKYEKRQARLAEFEREETRQSLLLELQRQQDTLKKAGD